jgi:hypothetical protein
MRYRAHVQTCYALEVGRIACEHGKAARDRSGRDEGVGCTRRTFPAGRAERRCNCSESARGLAIEGEDIEIRLSLLEMRLTDRALLIRCCDMWAY